ncbi:ergothioneine biosynthesis glutamate--cysteine ligase EgtA [Pseudonocardia acaciae]|uniref:ergothioneine biosynthesis glutamate--cysteine ligase EgtA n=1 Tax=Pseudonocardia acaciae TaxID=551276 RepID=UPI0007E8E611|nr:ergothioneine biosynthesis glutamate--cysteine ligase EgtA [Pseudonocardia acaciae]
MSPKAAAKVPKDQGGLAERAVRVLRSREEAEAYVASVCFKHGPPRLLGVELEWLLARRAEPPSIPPAPLDATTLVSALGPHTPRTLDPLSPALPLPSGSTVTVEPGGQVELASRPFEDLGSLVTAVESDAADLHDRLGRHRLYPRRYAADPDLPAHRVLTIPRYTAMEAAFDRRGTEGRSMMCSTAAVQPCLDLGERADLGLRWMALHALGPVLVAAFANSPRLHGRRTGWKSSRMACWLAIDPPRTAPPELSSADPVAGYARRAMEAGLICRRRPGGWDVPPGVTFTDWLAGALPEPPTTEDLDLHLSTLFPPVRPHGHVEVRYLDAQAGPEWVVPLAVVAALLSSTATTSAALEASLPVAGAWVTAARQGLDDPKLARAARTVFALASAALPALIGPGPVRELVDGAVERVMRGRCPADDTTDFEMTGGSP